ncbi:MAG: hypothetical protein IPK64_02925 [bacterium]|nr:hypothetical protein [bacterium]
MSRSSMLVSVFLVVAAASASAQTGWAPEDSSGVPVELPTPPVAAQPVVEKEPAMPALTAPMSVPEVAAIHVFNAVDDSLTVLVDYRAESEIQRELQHAVAEKAMAERNVERGRLLEKLAESRIEIKASEIKALEAQITFAKKEKSSGRQADLEGRRKYAESEKQLLERRRDLRKREIETARAVREYHEATEKSCRLELDLAVYRRERASIPGTADPGAAAEFARLQREITKLEGRVLQAQVEQASKRKDLAEQDVRLGKVRRAVYESQVKMQERGR